MATRSARFLLFALVCSALISGGDAGKVKQALFRALFGKEKDQKPHMVTGEDGMDADQREMVEWFKANGFAQFAESEWVHKFDDELAYDSIEDFTHFVADEEYEDVGVAKEVAQQMQEAARKHMLSVFLREVPLPSGAPPDTFTKLLIPLIGASYDEPDDVADLEEQDRENLGIERAHFKTLVTFAEEYEMRQLLHVILISYTNPELDGNPFADEAVHRPLIEALIASGARSLSDVSNLTAVEGVSPQHLSLLKQDPRVKLHLGKQEL
jgi:hypothetical protein